MASNGEAVRRHAHYIAYQNKDEKAENQREEFVTFVADAGFDDVDDEIIN